MKQLGFRLISTKIDQFASFEENDNPAIEFEFFSTLSFDFDREKNTLFCSCSVTGNKNNIVVVKGAVTFGYELDPISSKRLSEKESTELTVPKETLIFLASKTYGGLRGVLLAKLQNTNIRLVLPLTDLSEIITEPLCLTA